MHDSLCIFILVYFYFGEVFLCDVCIFAALSLWPYVEYKLFLRPPCISNEWTHEAEEADAVDARATAAEKTHDGEDEAENDQRDGYLFHNHDWSSLVVDEQRPQRQRLTPHVKPYTARYQRPTADLQHNDKINNNNNKTTIYDAQ